MICQRTYDSFGAVHPLGATCTACGHNPAMHTDHCGLCEVDALIQEFRDSIENISSIMVDRVIAEMNNRIARR